MSTILAMDNGSPVFHMTTDERTQAELKTGPASTTTFHSDLPYVFVREQFEVSSYTQWSGSDGGRKFTLPSTLQTFRANNPDLAYLMIMEDSSGNSWVHDPLVNVRASWYRYSSSGSILENEIGLAANGGDYQIAFTDTDSQLQDLTKNGIHGAFNWVFRTWDANDTSVTVFKTPMIKDCRDSPLFVHHRFPSIGHDISLLKWMTQPYVVGGTDLESSGLDVVKVRFMFLNITHSATAFELQKGFQANDIAISPSEFKVNQVDLGLMTPLISHGNSAISSSITPIAGGKVVCGKGVGLSLDTGKINSSNVLLNKAAPVIEVPANVTQLTGWDIDFNTRDIKRNNVSVFNDAISGNAVGVLGSQDITFSPSLTLTSSTTTSTVPSTHTGSLGNVDADTVYLASVVSGGSKLHSVALMGVGDNIIADLIVGEYQSITSSGPSRWSNNIKLYMSISSNGSVAIKAFREGGNSGSSYNNTYYNISSVNLNLPDFDVRLIALGNLS